MEYRQGINIGDGYSIMRTSLGFIGLLALGIVCGSALRPAQAGDWLSGTYLDPAQQRSDLFPRPFQKYPEYRQVYNRPRFLGGMIAHVIEPTSQEAMSWEENHRMRNYANHAGPYLPVYNYPKPWEALNTRAR